MKYVIYTVLHILTCLDYPDEYENGNESLTTIESDYISFQTPAATAAAETVENNKDTSTHIGKIFSR